jgi:tRNA nucleotidyltransferase (CCA-adding enzyme)
MMALRRTTYPQVEVRARDLMTSRVTVVPRTLPLEGSHRLARRRRARLVVARLAGSAWGAVTPAVLERGLALGLAEAPTEAVLWGAPLLEPSTPEITVRRALGPATPFVLVGAAGRPAGAVVREGDTGGTLPRRAAALARLDPATVEVLRVAGRLGAELGWPVAAVGGLVRDLVLDRLPGPPRDLDVTVDGDGQALARRLARALGGRVRQHDAFLTATVTLPDGRGLDVATARREWYRQAGALPVVEPASLGEDLARRDFSVNALAIRLDGPAWGEVLDPTGGLADLAAGRIRVLHPLSFVEDPTRIFRAARFAGRLGFRLTATTRRLLAQAAGLDVYAALSGDRLMAELTAILAEREPVAVLGHLGRLGAFRLGLPGYRFTRGAAAALAGAADAAGALGLGGETLRRLYLLALSGHLADGARAAWLARWGAPAPAREAIERARREGPEVARRLAATEDAGEAFAALDGRPELTVAWAWVRGDAGRVRPHVAAYLGGWRRLPPLLTGADLVGLGLAPGPRVGRLLGAVRQAQVAGRLRSRDAAVAWVRETVARGGGVSEENRAEPGGARTGG